jgi:cytochrome c peroxidase
LPSEAASGASETAVQTASPAVTENAASNAASAASVVVADSNASPKDQELLKCVQGIFKPLPRAKEMQKLRLFTEERVKLGHQLWYEPRLSKGDTVSCNSCHNLASTDVGDLPTGQGHKGQLGGRNSPRPL